MIAPNPSTFLRLAAATSTLSLTPEHTALHYGTSLDPSLAWWRNMGYNNVLKNTGVIAFIKHTKEDSIIELIPHTTPEHLGYSVPTKEKFFEFLKQIEKDKDTYEVISKKTEDGEGLLFVLFRDKMTQDVLQIVWRAEPLG